MPLNPEIRTGEIDEILGKAPGGLLRWGIGVFFCVILLIIGGSWFFKYPDVITASIEITGEFPPVEVKARVNGKIDTIFVQNNQEVDKNQILGIIENPATFAEVLSLKKHLDNILLNRQTDYFEEALYKPVSEGSLGELQPFYSSMVSSQSAFYNFIEIQYHQNRITATQTQLNDYRLLYNFTVDQRNTLEKDYQLALKDYDRHVKLFDDKVIPEQELERVQSHLFAKKLAFENSRTTLANLQIQIGQLKNSIKELEMEQKQQHEILFSAMRVSETNLIAQIENWEQRYLLRSPQKGNCVFIRVWAIDQNLNANETVFTILPERYGNIIGTMQVPASGAGKVKSGQKVNIRLDNYPYMEFGMLEGSIANISDVPEQGLYYATVDFTEVLKTSYGKELAFNQRLTGTAEIITNDIRLFHRILQPLKHLLHKNL